MGYDRNLPFDAVVVHEVDLQAERGDLVDSAWVRWQGSAAHDAAAV